MVFLLESILAVRINLARLGYSQRLFHFIADQCVRYP